VMLLMFVQFGTFKTGQNKGGIFCLYCWCCDVSVDCDGVVYFVHVVYAG
jgi:hypothetical protein